MKLKRKNLYYKEIVDNKKNYLLKLAIKVNNIIK